MNYCDDMFRTLEAAGRSRRTAAKCGGTRNESGVALLVVLWLAVALGFIGMATAQLVRTEASAVSNQIDAQRSYYLARGGIEAAVYSLAQPPLNALSDPDWQAGPSEFSPGKRWLQYQFPGGACTVEIVPENAKLNVNQAPPEQLAALFVALGLTSNDALLLADAVVDWRTPRLSGVDTVQDAYYANLPIPYAARHAAVRHLEELLPAKGMSQSLFFGHTERGSDGRWQQWPSLRDLLTTQTTNGFINPNYAAYEVLRSLPGWDDAAAAAVVAARAASPFRTMDDLSRAVPGAAMLMTLAPMTLSQGPVYSLTATATVPGSSVRRSVRALVAIVPNIPLQHRVLGWWDDWPSPFQLQEPARNADETGSHSQS